VGLAVNRIGLAIVVVSAIVGASEPRASGDPYRFRVPSQFPAPRVPVDNEMSDAKVELGRRLFYDERLSANETMSCATCHRQELAFTDGLAQPRGSTGDRVVRNSMGLGNVAYRARLTWANPLLDRLEHQALLPMFGDTPTELGLTDPEMLLARLRRDADYVERFESAFPDSSNAVTLLHVTQAIASFERTLLTFDSPFDRYVAGDERALSASAARGMELFFSERLECFHCHGGFDFADSNDHEGNANAEQPFHNTGLYDVDGHGSYPASDRGVIDVTERAEDMGRFRAPSLRNVAVTGPYMHDGSVASLEDVLRHYEAGGRAVESGPDETDAAAGPNKDRFIVGFVLTDDERADVVAFLRALTDESFLHDPRFGNPFR